MLNITKKVKADSLIIRLEGRIDTTTAQKFEDAIRTELANVNDLVLDLEKLDYISSAGLRVLLKTQKAMNKKGTMVVKNVSEEVKETFEVIGFADILNLE
jgi:anti-sigma B factor antagonist